MILNKTRKETKKLKKRGREVTISSSLRRANSYGYLLSALSEGVSVQIGLKKSEKERRRQSP